MIFQNCTTCLYREDCADMCVGYRPDEEEESAQADWEDVWRAEERS